MGDMADGHLGLLWDLDDETFDQGQEPIYIPYQEVLTSSDKAWFLLLEDGRGSWFPKSKCRLRVKACEVECPAWLAVAKGV